MVTKQVKLKDWQVAYLSSFMKRWDEFSGEDYSALISEYNEFLVDCKLPAISPDYLLTASNWRGE